MGEVTRCKKLARPFAALRHGAMALCLLPGLSVVGAGQAVAQPTESQVEAAFLLNFAKFVEWPPAAFSAPDSPFAVCILGEDPLAPRWTN
jgi:hypothetical protein